MIIPSHRLHEEVGKEVKQFLQLPSAAEQGTEEPAVQDRVTDKDKKNAWSELFMSVVHSGIYPDKTMCLFFL